jgi:hypothetical protein
MKTDSMTRSRGFAAVLVLTLAILVASGLALDHRLVYQRDVPGDTPAADLPEILVTAQRLET